MRPGKIVTKQRKADLQDAADEPGPGAVDCPRRLWGRTREIEGKVIAAFRQRQLQLVEPVFEPVMVEEGIGIPSPVGEIGNALPDRAFDIVEYLLLHGEEGVPPVFVNNLAKAVTGHILGGDLRA